MKIVVFPQSENPYMKLLYGALQQAHPEDTLTYLKASPLVILTFPFQMLILRIKGYQVFHLHWLVFYISSRHWLPFQKQLSFIYTLVCLSSIKLSGLKLIWTVHNALPHEQQTSNDLFIARYLSKIATAKIAHSKQSITQMQEHGLACQKVAIIPHGNYISFYPGTHSRIEARQELSLKPNDFVILFFGLIRPYKGVEELLATFQSLKQPNVQLVLAGKCNDATLLNSIKQAATKANVLFHEGYVEDKNVTTYFAAADIVCLPFKAITTSGSALLALSLHRPIIAPRIGALLDFPKNIGYLYDAQDENGLLHCLEMSINKRADLGALGAQGYEYASTLSWSKIARKTYNLYSTLV